VYRGVALECAQWPRRTTPLAQPWVGDRTDVQESFKKRDKSRPFSRHEQCPETSNQTGGIGDNEDSLKQEGSGSHIVSVATVGLQPIPDVDPFGLEQPHRVEPQSTMPTRIACPIRASAPKTGETRP
jgi:hypothetical protein